MASSKSKSTMKTFMFIALGFFGGILAAPMVAPMLAKIPVIGSLFTPKASSTTK